MTITVNGATNTITAPSGLTVAGNTAVTGTLSATGAVTYNSSLGEGVNLETIGSVGTQLKFGSGSTWTVARHYVGGVEVGTFSSTGLAVTGTLDINATNAIVTAAGTTGWSGLSVTKTGGSALFGIDDGVTFGYTDGDVVVRYTSGKSVNIIPVAGITTAKFSASSVAVNTLLDISNASAGQIKFPASQNASADANTLDDYEEGTWTPTLSGTGGSSGITYSSQVGTYTKIGRCVTVQGSVVLSGKTSITGAVILANMPFNVGPAIGAGISIGYFTALADNWASLTGYVESGTSYCVIGGRKSAGTAFENAVNADISATTRIDFSATYFV